MKYRFIIQEMKESGNPNVLAFLKDAEKIKRLSKRERDYFLQNRSMPGAVKRLVEEFIPYIIYVAYSNSHKTKTLSILDLINEGILGAYAAFERNRKGGVTLTKRKVNYSIKWNIKSAVLKDYYQGFADIDIEDCVPNIDDYQGEDELIEDINSQWLRSVLTEMIMEEMGSRDGSIIIDYYLGQDPDLKEIADKYGVSCERVRQITRNFSKLYKRVENLKRIRQM